MLSFPRGLRYTRRSKIILMPRGAAGLRSARVLISYIDFFRRSGQNRFVRALEGAFSIASRVFSILFFNFSIRKFYFRSTLGKVYKAPVRPKLVHRVENAVREHAVRGLLRPRARCSLAGWRGGAQRAAPLPVRAPGAPSGLDEARGRSPRPGAGSRAVKSSTPPWAPLER